jgi:flavin-dependent dehydrogenase
MARRGLDVLLVDKLDFPRKKTCGDALTPGAVEMLADMGVLEPVRERARLIPAIEIVAPGGCSIDADFPGDADRPGYGLTLPRRVADEIVRRRALEAGARFLGGVRVVRLSPGGDGITAEAEHDGHPLTIRARMAVIATGANVTPLLRSGLAERQAPATLAVRAYFDAPGGVGERIRFRFDGVPLPAYGWIFPLPGARANVGALVYPKRGRKAAVPARRVFEAFVGSEPVRAVLENSRQDGPLEGYPIRCDFASVPAWAERTLLVGEAAGLVNPLTGEGIDYALESGRIAGEHLAGMFEDRDLSRSRLREYDGRLRARYQRLLRLSARIRDLCVNRRVLDRLIGTAAERADLKQLLVEVLQGRRPADDLISPGSLFKALLAG